MRFAGLLVGLLSLSPGWGLAGESTCIGAGCSASATVVFKIVIPPPPLNTRRLPVSVTDDDKKPVNENIDRIIQSDGTVYVPSEHGNRPSYTVAKP